MCRDLSFGNELSHFISDASSKVPHITVSLIRRTKEAVLVVEFNLTLHSIQTVLGTDRAVDRCHITGIWVNVN